MIPREILAALRTIEIHTARLANEQLSGTYKSSFKGQGLAFREVRPYQPGDDIRTIDWNVSARMNETFVKVFQEEREMTVMLAVDLSASERFGTQRAPKARVASEVAALLAFSAIRNNDRIGLILSTSKVERIVPPKKGEKHVMRVVREILGFEAPQPAGARHAEDRVAQKKPKKRANDRFPAAPYPNLGAQTDLKAALEALTHVSRRRSVAFIVSDFLAAGWERALSLASAKHDVIPVVLVDRRDFELPDVGLATFEDLESGEMIVVDTSDKYVRAHFESEMKKIKEARRQVFLKLGIDAVEVDTGGSFVKPIRDLFARRARRIR
ncbi:MAG: DUF58 domain-containing protein [Labilithrix sp.]|nr:DUF58 domain-containing protein [Labilithrix sp.]MCW5812265.1 DUF58 domain-containing protein [Labilithrix sp.]